MSSVYSSLVYGISLNINQYSDSLILRGQKEMHGTTQSSNSTAQAHEEMKTCLYCPFLTTIVYETRI